MTEIELFKGLVLFIIVCTALFSKDYKREIKYLLIAILLTLIQIACILIK